MQMMLHRALVLMIAVGLCCTACSYGYPPLHIAGVSRVSLPGTATLEDPVWSPDGKKLAVDRSGSEESLRTWGKIFILDKATGELRLLVEKEDELRLVQAWSPDGTEIAFAAHPYMVGIWMADIWIVDADGRGEPRFLCEGDMATWSPSGQQMAVYANIYNRETDSMTGQIWILDLQTGNKRLAFERSAERTEARGLSWSPDGTRLAFSFGVGGRDEPITQNLDIYVLDLTTGDLHQLTHGGQNGYPTWSPDGSMIAFVGEVRKNDFTVTIIRADGTCAVKPLNLTGYFFGCAWSPDGQQIAFEWQGEIYTMDVAVVLGKDFLKTGPVCP